MHGAFDYLDLLKHIFTKKATLSLIQSVTTVAENFSQILETGSCNIQKANIVFLSKCQLWLSVVLVKI